MKRALIVLFIAMGSISISQAQLKPEVYLLKSNAVASKLISGQNLTKADSAFSTLLLQDQYLTKIGKGSDYFATNDHTILLFFKDGENRKTLNQAKVANITIHNKTIHPTFEEMKQSYFPIILDEYIRNETKGTEVVKIEIHYSDGKSNVFYFKYGNAVELYRKNENFAGFWIPFNMYSSNFKRTDEGILFSAMPVGLAAGFKWHMNNKFYAGFSLVCNYTITTAQNEEKKSFILNDLSLGVLIDLGGSVYIGAAKPLNLTNKIAKTEWQFMIGFGPEFLKFLAGK